MGNTERPLNPEDAAMSLKLTRSHTAATGLPLYIYIYICGRQFLAKYTMWTDLVFKMWTGFVFRMWTDFLFRMWSVFVFKMQIDFFLKDMDF